MKNRTIHIVFFIFIVGLLASFSALAATEIFVNGGSVLQNGLASSYATGADGTQALTSSSAYVLTSRGTVRIGATLEEQYPGGGGLVSVGGRVSVEHDTIKVGLNYFYSKGRDTGVEIARLENDVGSGYGFGYFNADREFVEFHSTGITRLSIKMIGGTGLAVYSTDTDEILYQLDETGRDTYLGIMPKSVNGEDTVTWFAGNKYYGGFEYAVLGGEKITVVNVVDLEKYVMGVCAREMSESWPLEALKAQAVAARTYVANSIGRSSYFERCGFDVTGDTYSQAYSGCALVGENIARAAMETAGQYVTYNGELCNAMYFSSSGGATEDNYNVNGNRYHPYLAAVVDPYEASADDINKYSEWTIVRTPSELAERVDFSDPVTSIVPTYSPTGNVIELVLTSSSGETTTLRRSACRTTMGMYSIRYEISVNEYGNFEFNGSGWGHNVGMSQFGAYAMARHYGKTYQDILGFYYTGVSLSYGDYGADAAAAGGGENGNGGENTEDAENGESGENGENVDENVGV